MDGASDRSGPVGFGRFTIVRHRREPLADRRAVTLGGCAFDTLIALVEARGSILNKHGPPILGGLGSKGPKASGYAADNARLA